MMVSRHRSPIASARSSAASDVYKGPEEGAEVPNGGRVEFRDAGARGTVVNATIVYDPPGGTIGKVIAKMFQREPGIQARRDLSRLKQYLETGEIATTMGQAAAKRSSWARS